MKRLDLAHLCLAVRKQEKTISTDINIAFFSQPPNPEEQKIVFFTFQPGCAVMFKFNQQQWHLDAVALVTHTLM